ncbi:hypothetical protein Lal_00018722 [Lupinus albus]|nr:hypothetical protein Lal_00018722 [Lupinus albus]
MREKYHPTYKGGVAHSKINFFLVEEHKSFNQRVFDEGFREAQGNANDMWEEMNKEIKKISKKILGESRGSRLDRW